MTRGHQVHGGRGGPSGRDLVPALFAHRVSGYEAQGGVSGEEWVLGLPALVDDLLREWQLEPVGPGMSGSCSVAIPVRLPDLGRGPDQGVLKVTWPHPEAATESLALQVWNGHGAVRLIRADPSRWALLLERLDDRDLSRVVIDEACGVIGGLLHTLRKPPHPRVPLLADYAVRQSVELAQAPPVIPRRYLDQAAALASELVARPPREDRLLHTDLHYANVLAAPLAASAFSWLAIDPKPMAGDPAFEVAPALWNRPDELGTGSSVRWSLRRRLDIICERAGIDTGRARAWTIVREADNALELADEHDDRDVRDRISLAVTIIKAMND